MQIDPDIYLKAAGYLACGMTQQGCCAAISWAISPPLPDYPTLDGLLWDKYEAHNHAFKEIFENNSGEVYYFGRPLIHVNEMHEDPMDDELFAEALNHRLMALAMMAAIVEDPA